MTIDFSPFPGGSKTALYDGPWVAERYHVAGALIEQQPDAVLPVIRTYCKALAMSAVAAFEAQYQLQAYKSECDAILAGLECVLTPLILAPGESGRAGGGTGQTQL